MRAATADSAPGGVRSGPAGGAEALFVLGPARSGTSLLYRMLCLHPQAGWISNWVRRAPRAPWLGGLNRLPRALPALRDRAWFAGGSNAYVYDRRRSVLERLAPQPVEGEPFFAACGLRQFDWQPAGDPARAARALRRRARMLQASAGSRVLVSKRIAHNRRVGELRAAFPTARFVALVRDGRATAASLAKVDWWADDALWWDGRTPRECEAAGEDRWALCARNWVEDVRSVESGLALVPAADVLQLRYEDLVADPRGVLGRVAGFAGLSADPAWLDAVGTLRTDNRNDAWRSLPADVVARIEAVQRETLLRYGYPV